MESPGFLTVLYCMFAIPEKEGLPGLPWANWTMAGMFTLHYLYRAILSPLVLNPSMSPWMCGPNQHGMHRGVAARPKALPEEVEVATLALPSSAHLQLGG